MIGSENLWIRKKYIQLHCGCIKTRPVHHQAYRYLKEYNKDIFKTKDDFIAEAIVYFAKYLQQEEEVQQMKLLNTLLENQKEQFCKNRKRSGFKGTGRSL